MTYHLLQAESGFKEIKTTLVHENVFDPNKDDDMEQHFPAGRGYHNFEYKGEVEITADEEDCLASVYDSAD